MKEKIDLEIKRMIDIAMKKGSINEEDVGTIVSILSLAICISNKRVSWADIPNSACVLLTIFIAIQFSRILRV